MEHFCAYKKVKHDTDPVVGNQLMHIQLKQKDFYFLGLCSLLSGQICCWSSSTEVIVIHATPTHVNIR